MPAEAERRREKLALRCPVVVEGKYDKIKLDAVVSTPVLVLNGFSVFSDSEKMALLRRLCRETGLILLTDSDRAGRFLRSRLKGMLSGPETDGDGGSERIYQVYAPPVRGKEKRKSGYSADGLLGIEGTGTDVLYELLLPFADPEGKPRGAGVTAAEWYADGFSGTDNASGRRVLLARTLRLPETMTGKALLEAVNLLISREQYEEAKRCLNGLKS